MIGSWAASIQISSRVGGAEPIPHQSHAVNGVWGNVQSVLIETLMVVSKYNVIIRDVQGGEWGDEVG